MKFMKKALAASVLTLTLTFPALADGVIGTGNNPGPNSVDDPGVRSVITEIVAVEYEPPIEAALSIVQSVLSLF